jgi:hypothetical protein
MGVLLNYLPGLASNCDPSNLSLPSNQDYRLEPPAPCCCGESVWKIGDLLKGRPKAKRAGEQGN